MALHTQSTVVVLGLIGSGHSCPEGGVECVDRDGVPCHPLLKADPLWGRHATSLRCWRPISLDRLHVDVETTVFGRGSGQSAQCAGGRLGRG